MANLDQIMNHIADNCIVEQGTSGIWKYRKYSDGTYHAWYEGAINLDYRNTFGQGLWFYRSRSAATPPSFSTSVTSFGGFPNSANLCLYSGHDNDIYTYWVLGAYNASGFNNYNIRYDLYGTW